MTFEQTDKLPDHPLTQRHLLKKTPDDLRRAGVIFRTEHDELDNYIWAAGTVDGHTYVVTRHDRSPEDGVVLWMDGGEDWAEGVLRFTRALD